MSYKPEVVADRSGQWTGNACRFATEQEAKAYVDDLAMRWTLVRDTRVIQTDDPVNCKWENGRAVFIDLESQAS
jgi:hypothetical protein